MIRPVQTAMRFYLSDGAEAFQKFTTLIRST